MISQHFPNYAVLWAKHVVPLTYRISHQPSILMRPHVPTELKVLATQNYNVFQHLVGCHELLTHGRPSPATRRGVYVFYSHLFSTRDAVRHFLSAVDDVIVKYGGVHIPSTDRHLARYGNKDLPKRFKEALVDRTDAYRTPQVHGWGFPMSGRRIPTRNTVKRWKTLGDLAAYLMLPGIRQRIAQDFVDARQQETNDLIYVEQVLNEIWEVALRELDSELRKGAAYREDQSLGADKAPPTSAAFPVTITISGSLTRT